MSIILRLVSIIAFSGHLLLNSEGETEIRHFYSRDANIMIVATSDWRYLEDEEQSSGDILEIEKANDTYFGIIKYMPVTEDFDTITSIYELIDLLEVELDDEEGEIESFVMDEFIAYRIEFLNYENGESLQGEIYFLENLSYFYMVIATYPVELADQCKPEIEEMIHSLEVFEPVDTVQQNNARGFLINLNYQPPVSRLY